ncbi:alpha/beta hydrolase [Roseinatronobacter sp. NSM]|uniref:alpha/beta hydrolase n=1 Tax=Roseinatronobacter sp. NSM TaxID=3457785 RepID=UPI0040361509
MPHSTGIDWDDAFANRPYIEDGDSFPDRWAQQAQVFRASHAAAQLDLPYGPAPREVFDLFLPMAAQPAGGVVFVHGGYWMAFDKSRWSHLAQGALAQGWAVAVPQYTLAPDARIDQMTGQMGRAIAEIARHVAGPIVLTGHSAGGHLVTRMACAGAPLDPSVQARIRHVLSISGLHDLRPLQMTAMNETLGLTDQMAVDESPALLRPLDGVGVTAWVGGHERPEFLRQAALLREAWSRHGTPVRLMVQEGLHHFNVIEGLASAESTLTRALLQLP